MAKKAAPKKKEPEARRLPQMPAVNSSETARMQAGFEPVQWHAAIALQVRVRDVLERPVSLAEALEFATQNFQADRMPRADIEWFKQEFDRQRENERQRREDERKAIAATAGR
jgi:hypothetical protein